MIKVNFVVHSFDKSRLGGVLKSLSNLLKHFDDYKYEVNVISLGKVDELAFPLGDNINLITLGMNKFDTTFYSGLNKFKWFWTCYKTLNSLIKSNENTIWISSSQPLSILFGLIKNKNNIMVGCEHASTALQKNSIYYKLMLIIYSRLDMMVSLTREDRDFYLSQNIKSELIPNAFDIDINLNDNKRNRVIFVGRFCSIKSPLDVLEIYRRSYFYKKGFKLTLYGYGDLYPDIINKINDLNLNNNVEIISGESNLDIMMKDVACLVLTSRSECLPSVLIEAISYNVPCISYDCEYGPRNIIKDKENGYLVQMGCIDEFAKYLSEDYLYPFWTKDIRKSISQFSIEEVTPKWDALFNSLIRKGE